MTRRAGYTPRALTIETTCLACERAVSMAVREHETTTYTCPACGHRQGISAGEVFFGGGSLGIIVGRGRAKRNSPTAQAAVLA